MVFYPNMNWVEWSFTKSSTQFYLQCTTQKDLQCTGTVYSTYENVYSFFLLFTDVFSGMPDICTRVPFFLLLQSVRLYSWQLKQLTTPVLVGHEHKKVKKPWFNTSMLWVRICHIKRSKVGIKKKKVANR